MYPHQLDRYYMMGYIMRQLRLSKRFSQDELGKLIESSRSTIERSRTPLSTLQRRISFIENFSQLKQRAENGQSPMARGEFIRTTSDGLGLSQMETDALLWLIEAADFKPLNKDELRSHVSLRNYRPREYSQEELRQACLQLLLEAVNVDPTYKNTHADMVLGRDEEDEIVFREKLLELEIKPGQRLLVSKYPSFLIFPGDAIEFLEGFKGLSPPAKARVKELTHKRRENFRVNIREYGERCIHSIESLRRYLSRKTRLHIPISQRRQHVQHLIKMLQENDRFEIALARVEPETELVIKSGQAAGLRGTAREIYKRTDNVIVGPLYLFWWSPPDKPCTTAYSFMLDFERAWHQVPKTLREKPGVIRELEGLLEESVEAKSSS
ncbi:MAG TPA: hypothetical protein VI306_22635 [Pyrinomonadaceae bacterium]